MTRYLEDFRPYEQSRMWSLHNAYYAEAGAAAWAPGRIPHIATTNLPFTRQHARVLLALVRGLEASGQLHGDQQVWLLEVGSGLGTFASNLLCALERHCGSLGRALLPRLRYILSDYTNAGVVAAAASPSVAAWIQRGILIPALFDIRDVGSLRALDGRPLEPTFVATFANYLCCAITPTVLHKSGSVIRRKLLRVGLRTGDDDTRSAEDLWRNLLEQPVRGDLLETVELEYGWGPAELAEALPEAFHQRVFHGVTADLTEATVAYPRLFLEFVRAMASRSVPGGAVMVSDLGLSSRAGLRGLREDAPAIYGATLNHAVEFAVFDEFCRAAGFAMLRTHGPFKAVHRAVIVYGDKATPDLRRQFRRQHRLRDQGQDLLDVRSGARALRRAGQHQAAARLYLQLQRIDASNPEWYFGLGQCCYEAGLYQASVVWLRRGARCEGAERFAFAFERLGRALHGRNRPLSALKAFRQALVQERDTATLLNLGTIYERRGRLARARQAYREALALSPDEDTARQVRQRLDAFEARVVMARKLMRQQRGGVASSKAGDGTTSS